MLDKFLESLRLKEETGYKVEEKIKEYTEMIIDKYNYGQLINNYNDDKLLLIKSIEEYIKHNECDEFIDSIDVCDYNREDFIFEFLDLDIRKDVTINTYVTIKADKIVVEKIRSFYVEYSSYEDEEIIIYNIPIEYFNKEVVE